MGKPKTSVVEITERRTDAAGRDQTSTRETVMTDVPYASVEIAEDGTATYADADGNAVDAEGKSTAPEPEPEPEPEPPAIEPTPDESEPATAAAPESEWKFDPMTGEPR